MYGYKLDIHLNLMDDKNTHFTLNI